MIVSIFHRAAVRRAGLLLGLGTALVSSEPGRADDVIPQPPPAAKYAKMAAHSPFAPPTAPVAPPAPPPLPGWADNLKATMVMQDGDHYTVTVVDSLSPQHLYLTMEPDPASQMAVVSVKWGANRDEPPTITLRKGKEFAQVHYEPGASASGGSNALGGSAIPGLTRNPPPIPGGQGAQPLRPPPLANGAAGQTGNPVPSSSLRRPLIRSQPTSGPLARPSVNPPNAAVRPNPGVQVDDDDD